MKLLHYKTRDKLFTKLHLWEFVSLQSKIRLKIWPNSKNAETWARVVRHNIIMNTKVNQNSTALKEINSAIINTIADENDISIIDRYLRKYDSYFSYKKLYLLSSIALSNEVGDASVKHDYLKAAYHALVLNDLVKAQELLTSIHTQDNSLSLGNWTEHLIKKIGFYEITHSGFEKVSPYCNVSETELLLFAEDYDVAIACLKHLPSNSKIKVYLFDSNIHPSSFNDEESRITASFYSIKELIKPNTPQDIEAIETAKSLASNIFNGISDETSKLWPEFKISQIKDSSELCIEDIILRAVREFVIFKDLATTPEIYFACSNSRKLLPYIKSTVQCASNKKTFVFVSAKLEESPKHNICISNKWYKEHLSQLYRNVDYTIPETDYSYNIRSYYKNAIKPQKIRLKGSKKYVAVFFNIRDVNYRKACIETLRGLLKKTNVILFYAHDEDKGILSTIDKLKEHAKSGRRKLELYRIIPAKPSDKHSNLNWIDYVAHQIANDSKGRGNLIINGIDYKFAIKGQIKNFLQNYLHVKLNMFNTLDHLASNHNAISSCLLSPGRDSMAWTCAEALKQKNIKILDQQVLFQSAYPRYRASKANMVGMLNQEQVEIYKQTFGAIEGQTVMKYGSVLFKLVHDRYNSINTEEIIRKYHLPYDKKLIVIATQNSLTKEFVQITSILSKLSTMRNDVFTVVKLHPREPEEYVEIYKNAVREHHAQSHCLVDKDIDLYSLIKASSVVVTIFSNAGMEAALCDKNVVLANLTDYPIPVDLAKEGLAVEARTEQELVAIVNNLLDGGNESKSLQDSRKIFTERNSELIDGNVLDRIYNYLLG